MNNAILRFGKTCVSMLVSGGLLAGGLFAAPNNNIVTVTLPHAVTVGSTTLPVGEYTVSSVNIGNTRDLFVIRGESGSTLATLHAQRVLLSNQSDKTQVVLSKDGDNWNFDKLVIQGDGVSYLFAK
ncbi:MAG: hypothetical protein JWN34_6176 [Bryobacterales bacterium]|jgi:hypothetical protein|nr:hypothetical protein [Bryobacterales bacterium]